jgi:TolB-like protein
MQLDVVNEQLWREGEVIPLRPKAFAVLRYLAEHSERLMNREELVRAVWGETKVSEGVLRGCLREVRQALGDSVETPQFIETVGRRGWRFIAPLNRTPSVQSSKFHVENAKQPWMPDAQPLTEEPPLPLPDKPSLVVLPFVNLSNGPEQDCFSDGITADLISDLSQVPDLFVIDCSSAFTYKGKAVKAQQVSRELGVRYVVEGSVSKNDDRVRIRVQLIDATNGFHLWSERYERELNDPFTLQDEVTRKIVTTLALQLPLWEKGWTIRKRTQSMEAYDMLLCGANFVLLHTQEANARARQLFEKAIISDPQYAWAYVSVADTYLTGYLWGWDKSPRALERAFALAQQAVALDPSIPTAHSVLSWI